MFVFDTFVFRVREEELYEALAAYPWAGDHLEALSPVDTVDKAFDSAVKSFNKVGATSEYVAARECKLADSVSADDIAARKYHTYTEDADGWTFHLVIAGD